MLSPDPEFLFLSRGHDLALTHLQFGLIHNVGLIALTGEIGAGKTTLLKYLLGEIPSSTQVALVFNTNLDPQALLEVVAREFEIQTIPNRKSDLLDVLYNHFMEQYARGRRNVIIIDEAQNLPLESFEELRMLSNLDAADEFLVQIVLVGQPQLRDRLRHPALSQLAQRISVHYHLSSLSIDEVADYINHRLKVSGYENGEPLFCEHAVEAIAAISGGIPRIISSICDAALTYAFAGDEKKITRETVEKVIENNELLGVSTITPVPQASDGSDGLNGSHPQSEVATALTQVLSHLMSLDARIRAIEASEQNGVIKVLQQMLGEEREKTVFQAQRASYFLAKYQAALRTAKKKGGLEPDDKEDKPDTRKRWRFFHGEKK